MTIDRITGALNILAETSPGTGATGGVFIGGASPIDVPHSASGKVQQVYVFTYDPATAGDNAKAFTISNTPTTGSLLLDTVAVNDPTGAPVLMTKIMGWKLEIRRVTPGGGAATTGTITLTAANWPGAPASFAFDCSADLGIITDFFKAITTSGTFTLTASGSNCGLTAKLTLFVAP